MRPRIAETLVACDRCGDEGEELLPFVLPDGMTMVCADCLGELIAEDREAGMLDGGNEVS